MLIYHRTSLFESQAQTVVNTVNCVGVMGKGVAAGFKDRYPDMFRAYKKICDDKLLEPGKLWLWQGSDQWVLNFPTKKHWRNPSKLEWIEAGLVKFEAEYERRGIVEISFPRLGCGNGGLDWDDVRPLMEKYLARLPIQIYIHDFEVELGRPEHLDASRTENLGDVRIYNSYLNFKELLAKLLNASGSRISDLESKDHFEAVYDEIRGLIIKWEDASDFIGDDELHGLWVSLQKGLLTKYVAKDSVGRNAGRLISIFSMLPDVRPVQIQRRKADEPEIAVELRRSSSAEITRDGHGGQLALSWH